MCVYLCVYIIYVCMYVYACVCINMYNIHRSVSVVCLVIIVPYSYVCTYIVNRGIR